MRQAISPRNKKDEKAPQFAFGYLSHKVSPVVAHGTARNVTLLRVLRRLLPQGVALRDGYTVCFRLLKVQKNMDIPYIMP